MGIQGGIAALSASDSKKYEEFIKTRTEYNKGWTIDGKSRGYVSSMIYAAENMPGTDPEFSKNYRSYVRDQMKKIDEDTEFKSDVGARDTKVSGLIDRVTVAKAKLEANPGDAGTAAEYRILRRQLDDLEDRMFKKTQALVKTPEEFKKEFEEKKNLPGNQEFIKKHGDLTHAQALKKLDEILVKASEDFRKANAQTFRDDLTKIQNNSELDANQKKNERLKLLAKVQGAFDRDAGKGDDTTRYERAVDKYILAKYIRTWSDNKENAKSVLNYVAENLLGLKGDDPKLSISISRVEGASDADRAKALAQQVVALYEGVGKSAEFKQEDYDNYNGVEPVAPVERTAKSRGGKREKGGPAEKPGTAPKAKPGKAPSPGHQPVAAKAPNTLPAGAPGIQPAVVEAPASQPGPAAAEAPAMPPAEKPAPPQLAAVETPAQEPTKAPPPRRVAQVVDTEVPGEREEKYRKKHPPTG
jgi:hypothetical protein